MAFIVRNITRKYPDLTRLANVPAGAKRGEQGLKVLPDGRVRFTPSNPGLQSIEFASMAEAIEWKKYYNRQSYSVKILQTLGKVIPPV